MDDQQNPNQGQEESSDQAPAIDPKTDHDANHKETVEGCEYC